MPNWTTAPAVRDVAKPIIASHYPELHGIDIVYVFRDKAMREKGKIVAGTMEVKRGLDAMLYYQAADSGDHQFFLMKIARDIWDDADPDFREYLVDHELAHTAVERVNGIRQLSIVPHDIEEFGVVIQRHGVITPAHSKFLGEVGKAQLELFASQL